MQSQDKQIKLLKHQLASLSEFLVRFTKVYDGALPSIDGAMQTLRNQLQNGSNIIQIEETLGRLTGPILENMDAVKHFNLQIRNTVDGFANELLINFAQSIELKQNINTFINELKTTEVNLSSTVFVIQRLIGHAQAVIIEVAESESLEDELNNRALHEKIVQEIKELISQLLAAEPEEKSLQDISKRLEEGITRQELMECCLLTLRALMEEMQQERKHTERYVNSLHQSLVNVGNNVVDSIAKSEQNFEAKEENSKTLRSHMEDIGATVENVHNLEELKAQASETLQKMAETLTFREQADKEEQVMLMELLSQMKAELASLEKETEAYKQRLVEQKYHSHRDPLTQVPNRNAYNERMELEFRRWKRHKHPLGIAIVDIDHFKNINDSFGHAAGDKTLQVIAQHISKCLRNTDFFARWGGEEFIILLPQTPLEHMSKPIETIRKQIQKIPFKFRDRNVSITASIGATCLSDGDSVQSAFDRADRALYEAKDSGRNRCVINEG